MTHSIKSIVCIYLAFFGCWIAVIKNSKAQNPLSQTNEWFLKGEAALAEKEYKNAIAHFEKALTTAAEKNVGRTASTSS